MFIELTLTEGLLIGILIANIVQLIYLAGN